MNELRVRVQRACEDAATRSPGAFRLTVPTGGGKTLGSILFALAHACEHASKRGRPQDHFMILLSDSWVLPRPLRAIRQVRPPRTTNAGSTSTGGTGISHSR